MRNLATQLKALLAPTPVVRSGAIKYGSAETGFMVIDDISGKNKTVYGDGAAPGDTVLYVGDRITQVLGPATTTIVTV